MSAKKEGRALFSYSTRLSCANVSRLQIHVFVQKESKKKDPSGNLDWSVGFCLASWNLRILMFGQFGICGVLCLIRWTLRIECLICGVLSWKSGKLKMFKLQVFST